MKTLLYCRIFGHKFIGKDSWYDKNDTEIKHIKISSKNFCQNCGLSKEEVFKIENI